MCQVSHVRFIDESEAQALKKAYEKAFSEPDKTEEIKDAKQFFTNLNPNNIKMENIPMTTEDIKEAIDELSVTASPGPDGVPALMRKKCRDSLIEPVFILWSKSIDSETFLSFLEQLMSRQF